MTIPTATHQTSARERMAVRLPSFTGLLWLAPIAFLAFIILYPLLWLFFGLGQGGIETYVDVLSARYVRTLWNTVVYATGATVLALVIGLPLAWILARTEDSWIGVTRPIIAVAFVLPAFIYAMAYIFLLAERTGFITRMVGTVLPDAKFPLYGLAGMCFVAGMYSVPQVLILVEPALRNISSDYEEAAEVCGATGIAVMTRIVLPMIFPTVLAAALLSFVVVFAGFGIPAALGIPIGFYVLATDVFSVISAYPPQFDVAAALSFIFLIVGAALAFVQHRLTRFEARYQALAGKGLRVRPLRVGRAVKCMFGIYAWLIAFAVSILPVAVVIGVSFAKRWWELPNNLTLDHYAWVTIEDPLFAEIVYTTLTVAFFTVIGVLLLAISTALYARRHSGPLAGIVKGLGFVAFTVPPIAFTIGALLAYINPPLVLYGTVWILVISYIARFYPLAATPISNGFGQIDRGLIESAQISGASGWRTFFRIELPLILPTALATALIVLMFTVRELLSAVFLQSSQVKMAMVGVYNYWSEGNFERAAVIATFVMLFSGSISLLVSQIRTRTGGWQRIGK